MYYGFLKDFHKRMEIVSIVEFIVNKISRKAMLKERGFEDDESINLVMLVLCFIMEKSLLDEPCSKEDIASYLRTLDVEYFKKVIADDDYIKLADYIIRDCLQNGGAPYYFNTFNYELGQQIALNVKLIDDKRVTVGNEKIYSYYLTPQGYRFLFNTLEIEEAMQVSIEQFKLTLAIKKRNFSSAKNNVDNLFNLCKTQIHKIDYFIKRVREDIGSTGIEEYEAIYKGTFETINEQKDGYDNLYILIENTEKELLSQSNPKSRDDLLSDIDNISYIKNKLKFIINEQTNLLLKQQELQKIYNDAIDNILYIGFENRLDLEAVILDRIDKKPILIEKLIPILRPLFKPSLKKIFNINKAFSEQKIVTADEEDIDRNILMDGRLGNNEESENEKKIREMNNYYVNIMDTIFRYMIKSNSGKTSVSEIISSLKRQGNEEYKKFVPKVRVLMNVLLQLCSIKTVDVVRIVESKNKTIFNPSEEFDIKYCVLELLSKDEKYSAIENFEVLLSRNKNVAVLEELVPEDTENFSVSTIEQLICPEIAFIAEVKR